MKQPIDFIIIGSGIAGLYADQGWVEGALESVDAVVTREWVNMM
jgi:succinate dehydrogenase/fumarate reductase flavoprotein subunit